MWRVLVFLHLVTLITRHLLQPYTTGIERAAGVVFIDTKKQHPNTGARANITLHK